MAPQERSFLAAHLQVFTAGGNPHHLWGQLGAASTSPGAPSPSAPHIQHRRGHAAPPPVLLPHGISSRSPRPRLAQPHAFRVDTRRPVKPILQQEHGPEGKRCCGSTARCCPQPLGSAGHCSTAAALCSVLVSIKAFLSVKTTRGRATAEAAAGLGAAETSR